MGSSYGRITGYISDGFTADGYFHAEFNRWPEIRFVYRKMTQKARRRVMQAVGERLNRKPSADVDGLQNLYAALISRHVLEWDLMKDAENPLDRTNLDDILGLEPKLFERFIDVIMGEDGGDEPESGRITDAADNDPLIEVDALTYGETIESATVKNSSAG